MWLTLAHVYGILLMPNQWISFVVVLLNAWMIRTPYLCFVNCVLNMVGNMSWCGVVFSMLWLLDSQNLVIGELPGKFRKEVEYIVSVSKDLKPDNSEIFWTSVFADNGQTTNIPYSQGLYDYISGLRWQIMEFWCKRINGFGTLINPSNSVEQDWHIDYTWSYTSLFIPIENCTSSNMTQIMTSSIVWGYFHNSRNIKEKEQENVMATIIVPRKWSLLLLPPSTFHRGVKNNSDMDRTLFWISYQSRTDPIEHEHAVQDFTKKSIDL